MDYVMRIGCVCSRTTSLFIDQSQISIVPTSIKLILLSNSILASGNIHVSDVWISLLLPLPKPRNEILDSLWLCLVARKVREKRGKGKRKIKGKSVGIFSQFRWVGKEKGRRNQNFLPFSFPSYFLVTKPEKGKL